jgi:uncharacterized protein (TIGR03067 family)
MRQLFLLFVLLATSRPITAAEPARPATSEQLGELLRGIGYQPKSLAPEIWQATVRRDGWDVHVMVSLSGDGERVWLECKFAVIDNPEIIPSKAWFNLLAANERIGPAYFAFDRTDNRVHLFKAFDNLGIDAARLKKEIDGFDAIVRKTQNVWRGENFAPSEMIPVLPRAIDDQPKKKSVLEGEWRVARVERNGQSITGPKALGENPKVIIEGDVAILRTGLGPERRVRLVVDSTTRPPRVDFIDDKLAVEEGIYTLDEPIRLLTICFAAVGGKRPDQFVTEENDNRWLMVLKRER